MKITYLGRRLNNNNDADNKSRGLGDTIEKITTATGIKQVVENISHAVGADCGCGKRKDALNRIFPYKTNQ
jgi:hypothetical protein